MTIQHLPCDVCGMIATTDPNLHAERYGHTPEVIMDGCRHRWSDNQRWMIVLENDSKVLDFEWISKVSQPATLPFGVVLGYAEGCVEPYVTWMFARERGTVYAHWGHYFPTLEAATQDYEQRIAQHQPIETSNGGE